MGIYAARPARLVGQLIGDLAVVGWAVLWGAAGFFVDATIAVLAVPARQTAQTAAKLAGDFSDASVEAAKVPGVGDQLRRPFDAAAGTLGNVVAAANDQVQTIERVALITGWLTFLIPVSIVLAFWLPRRIAFYRRARAAARFLDASADLDLFALRALALQPMHVLAGISDDPVAAWRNGDRATIERLAELELHRSGLRLPERLRSSGADPKMER